MKILGLVFAGALACAISTSALAAPPGVPHISVHASDIRQLEFNWAPVVGVHRYELWFRANPGATWVKYQEQDSRRSPRFRIGVGVHLLDWRQARYYVKACNPSGCSASNQVGVDGEQLVAMGYIKPSSPTGHEFFGNAVALSADGRTLAVLTAETLGGLARSAVVHVYRRTTSISGWRREARLLPSTVQAFTGHVFSGDPLALSADGNLLAFGSWRESVPGSNGPGGVGAVYLFRRTGSTWALGQKLTREPRSADYFGHDVKVDDAGRTIVVSHYSPHDQYEAGTLEVYRDAPDSSDLFVHSTTLATPLVNNEGYCDGGVALSGDGQTLLRGCRDPAYVQVFNGPDFSESARVPGTADALDITYDGTVFLGAFGTLTYAYKLGPGGWVRDGDLSALSGFNEYSQRKVAISRDGKIAAIGDAVNSTAGLGPIFPPYQIAETRSGAVTVFERKNSGWTLRRWVKPGSTNDQWFGHVLALGDNGRILAVGAPFDASAATGIDGDRDDASMPDRGAVWIY